MAHRPDQYDRFLDEVDLDTDIEDLELDRRQLVLLGRQGRYMRDAFRGMRLDSVELHKELASVRRLVRQTGDKFMGAVEDLTTLVTDLKTSQEDEAVQLDKIIAQLAEIQDGNVPVSALGPIIAELQARLDASKALATRIDTAIEVEGEDEPPVEPPAG